MERTQPERSTHQSVVPDPEVSENAFGAWLREQKSSASSLARRIEALREEVQFSEETMAALWRMMGWRERYIGGWLWGDRKRTLSYWGLEAVCSEHQENLAKIEHEKRRLDKAVQDALFQRCAKTDAVFQELVQSRDELEKFKKVIDRCLRVLRPNGDGGWIGIAESAECFRDGVAAYEKFVRSHQIAGDVVDEVDTIFELIREVCAPDERGGARARLHGIHAVIARREEKANRAIIAYIEKRVEDA